MAISTEVEKAYDTIQRPLMIRTLDKLEIEGNFVNFIKTIYKNPTLTRQFSN